MVSFSSLLLVCTATAAILAAPSQDNEKRDLVSCQSITTSQTSTNNGYYYSFWRDDAGQITYTNGPGGQYSITWSDNAGNWVGGKGWNLGAAMAITYSGTYSPNGNSYLSVYGWTTSPLIEYTTSLNPSACTTPRPVPPRRAPSPAMAEPTTSTRPPEPKPSIQGMATFQQYWSVCQSHRVGGTITTGNHFNAWATLNMNLSSHDYQIVATEGYQSRGSASITIGSGTTTTTTTTTTTKVTTGGPTTTTTAGNTRTCSAKWGQCDGQGWTGATCCQSGLTCQYSNAWYSQCL